MRKINRWTAFVVGGALALAGCGSDSDDDNNPDIPLTAITADNAAQVSAVVYQATSALFYIASTSGTLPLGAVVQPAAGGSGAAGLVSFAARQLKAVAARPLSTSKLAVGTVYEETFACAGGGTVTERVNDADDNGEMSVGDGLRLTFVNCVEEGATSNGVLGFNLTLLAGASTGAKVTFDNLVINDGTDTMESDGAFNLTVTQNPGVSELYEIAGEFLASTLNGDRHTITGFSGSAASDLVASSVTYTFGGRVSDSSNNISVDAETVNAFVGLMADDYPGSGSLRSIGAANSQALLEALSSTLVRISVDPEGDGTFTPPVEWNWSALEALTD